MRQGAVVHRDKVGSLTVPASSDENSESKPSLGSRVNVALYVHGGMRCIRR